MNKSDIFLLLFHSFNKSSNHVKTFDTGLQILQASNAFKKVLQVILRAFVKFGEISFREYVSDGTSQPVFFDCQVCKIRWVKGEAIFVPSGSKIVKGFRRQKYDKVIIERTVGLVL